MYNLNSIKNCFESIIDFIEKTDTSGKTKFIGSTPSEIDAFETKYNIQVPPILHLYLQYFGGDGQFYGNSYFGYTPKLEHITMCVELAQKHNLLRHIQKFEPAIQQILPFCYDVDRGNFIFIDYQSKDEQMYCFPDLCIFMEDEETLQGEDVDEDEEIYKWSNIWATMQEWLFLFVNFKFNPIQSSLDDHSQYIDLSKIEWTKFHIHYHKEKNQNYNSSDKHIFRKKLTTIEHQTGEVLDFETYEIEYIKYLIEERGVPAIPHIFDPYTV